MPLIASYPIAVLTVVLLALVAMSHTEPALDQLCESQMVRNGFSQVQAANRCAKF